MEDCKIWFLADTHFGLKGDDPEWLSDYIGYFEDTLIPIMKSKVSSNDILVHCGDVFDNRSTVGLDTLTRTIHLFEEFSNIFKDIRIIVGNHDIMKKSSTEVTALHALKYIPNVKVYFNPEVEVISGKTVLFNPWIESPEKEKELLDSVNVNYVFGHLQIGGSKASDRLGTRMDITAGVNRSDFKSAQVYAGHIHIKQDEKNIHYVGNPYHKDRGDIDNVKGITILDIKTGKTEFIENTVSPKYMRENLYDIMNLTIGELKTRWKNNRVDLHLKSTDSTKCSFDELRSCLCTCYRTLDTRFDNTPVELVTEGNDMTFNDVKNSDNYMSDFLDLQDLSPERRSAIDSVLEGYRERV